MTGRRDDLLDAAICLLGERGTHALTHRAVDAAAGLPAGSASNYFRTRDALLNAVVERFAARERANWEDIAAKVCPTTPQELAQALTMFARDSDRPAADADAGPVRDPRRGQHPPRVAGTADRHWRAGSTPGS